MGIGRRKFFGFMGGAAVGGPALAKQAIAATGEALAGTGVSVAGLGGGVAMPPMGGISGGNPASAIAWNTSRLSLIKLAKTLGIPSFKRKEMRDYAYHSPLDLDIASFVSVSPVMKAQMQRDRSYQRQMQDWEEYPQRQIERAMWAQANGGELP